MRDLRKANEMLERITESVCRMLGDVKPSEVAGRSRTERVATARHIVAWAMVRIHKFSLADTGMAMNRNHGTIINSIKIVESWSNWPLQNAKLLTITKKLKETMKREDEIKANAEAYGLGEYTKAGFIAGAEWADAHPRKGVGYEIGYEAACDKAVNAIESYTEGLLDYFKKVMGV